MQLSFYRVLVVENDPDEQRLFQHVFEHALKGRGSVHPVDSGEAAISYLLGDGDYADRKRYPFPSVIILDLNMYGGDGFSVLDFLRLNPGWSVVPRIVFSASCDDDDVKTAYVLGATAYHCKPDSYQKLRACVELIVNYWTTCEVPPIDANGRLLKTSRSGKLGERYPVPIPGERMIRPPTS